MMSVISGCCNISVHVYFTHKDLWIMQHFLYSLYGFLLILQMVKERAQRILPQIYHQWMSLQACVFSSVNQEARWDDPMLFPWVSTVWSGLRVLFQWKWDVVLCVFHCITNSTWLIVESVVLAEVTRIWFEWSSPKVHMKSKPQNVILFGNKVIAKAISKDKVILHSGRDQHYDWSWWGDMQRKPRKKITT